MTCGSAISGGAACVLMAGDGTKGHPAGTKTGDVIHVFQGGSIQMLTDVSIDPAGNVWAANNWNSLNGAASPRSIPPDFDLGRRRRHFEPTISQVARDPLGVVRRLGIYTTHCNVLGMCAR